MDDPVLWCFPAIFRGDLLIGVLFLLLQWFTFVLAGLIWAFNYNTTYTTKLIEQGYEFADSPMLVNKARGKLGIAARTSSAASA